MAFSLLQSTCDRLTLLTDSLRDLTGRVREAVATEVGRAVADAVRDVLTTALRVRIGDPAPVRSRHQSRADDWPDVDDGDWGDDRFDPDPVPRSPAAAPAPSWAAALSVAVTVTKWLWGHRIPLWPCFGVGVLVTAAALRSGPVVRAALAAVATAADLVTSTPTHPR